MICHILYHAPLHEPFGLEMWMRHVPSYTVLHIPFGSGICLYTHINYILKLWIFEYVQLDLYLLSQKWKELVEKARSKQLQPHEYNSGL